MIASNALKQHSCQHQTLGFDIVPTDTSVR